MHADLMHADEINTSKQTIDGIYLPCAFDR
ncbi:hypothetical protein FB381_4363 [Nocardioides albertanoniae]|jgi:hypothetical protein|uniref:Uncharacterized protein n=1 Tax=Nocardioides albertanoniae TaxID=1175486 RepID=A0A543AD15_9ACTN|nr:hypothetical protein FB381_4363 [Nocardioides albertanoniae]